MPGNATLKTYGETADVLKPLHEVHLPDPRHNAVVKKQIEQLHAPLMRLSLNAAVPSDVQIGFDTARNLFLYSWFVYRFGTSARFQAYATLEYAIKARAPKAKLAQLRGLRACFDYAIAQKWFKDEGIRQYRRLMRIHNESSYLRESMGEIPKQAQKLPDEWLQRLKETFPYLRNAIAHGRPLLLGGDFLVLEMCCDLINQLFPDDVQVTTSVK